MEEVWNGSGCGRSGEISVHDRWTNSGRLGEFWGLTKSFGDNPGDSKIPLDLGLCIRECIRRTGERTPTGAERPSLPSDTFGWRGEENDFGSRGGGDSGRGEKPHASKRRVPGNRGGERRGSFGAPSCRLAGGHGQRSTGSTRRRHRRRHGQPGQRERRQASGPGNRVRVQLRQRRVGRPIRPGRGAPSPGNRWWRRSATEPGNRQPGQNGHRPPSLRARRAMCRSSEG
jgi:hypothetical protein